MLGRFPKNAQVAGGLPVRRRCPPLGLPELTIRSRPDVVAAEYNLLQTFANTRVAHLSRWPQLDANLGLALQNAPTSSTTDLFDLDGLAFSIGATLAQTIFDGGAIQAASKPPTPRSAPLSSATARQLSTPTQIVNAIDPLNTLEARDPRHPDRVRRQPRNRCVSASCATMKAARTCST